MIFWILAGVLTALVVAVLLLPLMRRRELGAGRAAYDQTVYRDQLSELERERESGLLPEAEAEAAKREIERRLLMSDDAGAEAEGEDPEAMPAKRFGALVQRVGVILVVVLLPLGGMGLYLSLGSPGLPGLPFAERQGDGAREAQMLVAQLERRLESDPQDAEGWLVLARVYERGGRYLDAAEAYRKIIALGRGGAEVQASLGEVLIAAAGGQVVREARLAFAEAIGLDPANPRARYYAGLAMAQDGRIAEALAVWRDLIADSPPDAPWRPLVERQIANAAGALGEPPPAKSDGGSSPRGPTAADVEAMQDLSAEDRAEFIRSMVERLAARLEEEPEDPEGWLQLARSYAVLGESEAAQGALEQAAQQIDSLPASAAQRGALKQRLEALRASLP